MNAIRDLVARAYDRLFPLPEVSDLSAEEYAGWTDEQYAEHNRRIEARLARIEREKAQVRRELEAEERNMRRGTG
jgi:hypothetical protein